MNVPSAPFVRPAAEVHTTAIPILSFFTGAGFLDLGFKRAGFQTIWRNEYDKWFVRGFEHAISALQHEPHEFGFSNTGSIIEVGPRQIANEAFPAGGLPDLFGVIGGPPCPDFSVGGKNRGHEGEHGKLSEVYVRRISELKPTFFVFENVPGLLRTTKHRKFLLELLRSISDEYRLDMRVLNALELGAPQDRQRVIIVGFRKKWLSRNTPIANGQLENTWLLRSPLRRDDELNYLPGMQPQHWFPWPRDDRYTGAKKRFKWPDTNPFGAEGVKPEGTPDELMVYNYICDQETLASLPNGLEGFRPKSQKFDQILEGDSSRKSFKRLHRYRYSPAAAYGNNEVHLHPTLPRRITVREALRIQTVPDEYVLPPEMPLSSKFKTIGNGVPVKLAEAVGRSIMRILRGDVNEAL